MAAYDCLVQNPPHEPLVPSKPLREDVYTVEGSDIVAVVRADKRKDAVVSALLTLGARKDRILSLIYGFNFQPYGPSLPPGFTIWGHAANGSLAALGTYITFRLYRYGEEKNRLSLRILALAIFATIGAIIPYMNDAEHIVKNGAGGTLPAYIAANDAYVFLWGLLSHRILKPRQKAALLGLLAAAFVLIHFTLYAPMFPEFYWS
ncbi:hypothetical protein E3J20_02480 [Candidatus Bathyarchaeota archaeon]|nr:MAG: hypothetical protein E3J20_02480 [Candidatus Bathyarchaeota archaeon]